jgi:hypothetical protein
MIPWFSNVEFRVGRHHHTNYAPQLVRDPQCLHDENFVGVEGFTRDNMNVNLIDMLNRTLITGGFHLVIIDHTELNQIENKTQVTQVTNEKREKRKEEGGGGEIPYFGRYYFFLFHI